ncbi:hypothetical protein [Pseudoalteromonas rubra]|uniref:Uncharacterized protein n=1 Tax=Pseudoalteromonas rubra TaxID=43658 RepID=A0A0U3IN09_9GAMM|nr:hypothetical protein [Pseudoalteromonas rubra]ALU44684.1 hypothetical protein AT705_18095 [Pseudoalteromonas rubra]
MNLKPTFIIAAVLTSSTFSLQAGTIVELSVERNLAVFKTTDVKSPTAPGCVASENKSYWSTDLSTDSGRATYSSLVTAMSIGASVEVTSSGTCVKDSGYELAKRVSVLSIGSNQSGKTITWAGFAGPYQGDFAKLHAPGRAPIDAIDHICHNKYPGSRGMRWEDRKDVIDELTQQVWTPDAIEEVALGMHSKNSSHTGLETYLRLKNGMEFNTFPNPGLVYKNQPRNFNCFNFNRVLSDEYYRSYGIATTKHSASISHCASRLHLACVKDSVE